MKYRENLDQIKAFKVYNSINADCLEQIHEKPIWDGDLISKQARDEFVKTGLVKRCEGYNIITSLGRDIVYALKKDVGKIPNPIFY